MEVEGSQLLEYRAMLYVPGKEGAVWFRINPDTFRAEILDPGSNHPGPCWYAVSNRFGLVGGRRSAAVARPILPRDHRRGEQG